MTAAKAPHAGAFVRFRGTVSRPPWLSPHAMALHLILFALVGAVAGFAFHRVLGCRTGACAIWSNPYVATIYGALIGVLLGYGA